MAVDSRLKFESYLKKNLLEEFNPQGFRFPLLVGKISDEVNVDIFVRYIPATVCGYSIYYYDSYSEDYNCCNLYKVFGIQGVINKLIKLTDWHNVLLLFFSFF